MRVNLCVWGKRPGPPTGVLDSTFYVERLISKKRDNGKSVSISLSLSLSLAVARQSPIYLFIYSVYDFYNGIQN